MEWVHIPEPQVSPNSLRVPANLPRTTLTVCTAGHRLPSSTATTTLSAAAYTAMLTPNTAWGALYSLDLRQMPFDQYEFDMLAENFFGLKQSNINMASIQAVKSRVGGGSRPGSPSAQRPSERLTRAAEGIRTPGLAAELYRLRAEDFLLMPLAKLKLLYALRCLTYCRESSIAAHPIRPTSRVAGEERTPLLENSQEEAELHLVDMLLTKQLEIGTGNRILMHDAVHDGDLQPAAGAAGAIGVGVAFRFMGEMVHLSYRPTDASSEARAGAPTGGRTPLWADGAAEGRAGDGDDAHRTHPYTRCIASMPFCQCR